ncbi:probable E3 ubiquitin-protein ligase HECTD2 [Lingula anatina]|uniref:HECT-type E3 ubiquitin transferase n=1 Tax=Lingula anatina TaxID=7574 RepID=A0A1S3KH86_LINAN|nr:probable E3 ubiquitin-protein ligase HECTD2 [Lingula anatina]|eukprot:XP_013421867.1 probable E3 ubiquitin-protein ligase HECTD2 [Lingula anatina]
MASQASSAVTVVTCKSCNTSVTQQPGTRRTICPNCGNFYDPRAAVDARLRSRRKPPEEKLPELQKNEKEKEKSGGAFQSIANFFHNLGSSKKKSNNDLSDEQSSTSTSLPPISHDSKGRLTVTPQTSEDSGCQSRSSQRNQNSPQKVVYPVRTKTAEVLKSEVEAAHASGNWKEVQDFYATTFDSFLELNAAFKEKEKEKSGGAFQSIANFFHNLGSSKKKSNNDLSDEQSSTSTSLPPISHDSKGRLTVTPQTSEDSGCQSRSSQRNQNSPQKVVYPVRTKTAEVLKSEVEAAHASGNWKEVQDFYATTFDSFLELNAAFKKEPSKEYKTTDDPGLKTELVNTVFDFLLDLPQDIQKIVLKAIINSLLKDKRPHHDGAAKQPHSKDDLRAYLILLQNPQFENVATYVILAHLLRQVAALSDQDHHFMVHWMKVIEEKRFKDVINRLHLFVSCRLFPPKPQDLPPMSKCTWWIPSATKVLALLNAANNVQVPPLVKYTEFYNTTIDHLDVMAEYYAWQNPSTHPGFTFCQYPFILSITAKRTILQRDSEQQMIVMARRSLVAKVQRRQLPDIGMLFMNLNVRRSHLVSDSLNEIARKQHDLKKKLKVTFEGEPGLDMGGLTKEWFLLLIRQIFRPEYGMFTFDKESNVYWFSSAPCDNYQEFNLVGVLMGLAVYNSINLDIRFPLCCYQKLLSPAVVPYNNPSATVGVTPLGVDDLSLTMPGLAKGLKELLEYEGDVEDDFCMTFQVSLTEFGHTRTHSLKPNGEKIPVTNKNRKEYVQLYVDWILNKSIYSQFQAFYHGFHSVCASNALIMLRPEEVEMLVCGSPELNMEDLKKVTTYDGYTASDTTIKVFWELVCSMPKELQKRLLLFTTGSDRIPIGGMSEMQFKITKVDGQNVLPMSHTCFNQLVLPNYKHKKTLKQKLLIAIQNAEGFGIE